MSKSSKKEDIKKTANIKKASEIVQWEFSHKAAFWGLAALLFLPPFFRGLFFQPEQEKALILAAVVFWFAWLWKWSKRDNSFLSHPLDYFVLAFPVVYLISAFQAANYGLAVDEVVKTTLYFMVYWLVSRLVRSEQEAETLLRVIYISAIFVALAGLATATGVIHINDGYLGDRIQSTFQYANALASYLAAITFIGLYFWYKAGLNDFKESQIINWLNRQNVKQYLYTAGNFILFSVFLCAKSQGVFLVFAIIFVLFIIGLPKDRRLPITIHLILVGIISTITIRQFLPAVEYSKMGTAWLYIIAGLAFMLAVQFLYNFVEKKGSLKWVANHKKIVVTGLMLVIIFISIGSYFYISGHSEVANILARKIKLWSFQDRVYFFKDAMQMFRDRPILGWGGGGWQEAYRAYQSFLYNSKQVHGYYQQVLVETGILGLLVVLGTWVFFLYTAHQLYRGAKELAARRTLIWTVFVAAISIGLHAAIDFDLSLSALALVLYTMFGITRGILLCAKDVKHINVGHSKSHVPLNYTSLVVFSVASLVIMVFSGLLITSNTYKSEAAKYFGAQNIQKGIELLKKASQNNPLDADLYTNMARINQQQGKFDEAMVEAQQAVKISKYSAQRYTDLASISFYQMDIEDSLNYGERAIALAPFQVQCYELMSHLYLNAGCNRMIGGRNEEARQYLLKAAEIPSRINDKMNMLNDTEKKLWTDAPLMSATPTVQLSVGEALYLLGKWPEAEVCLQTALQDEKTKGEASLWIALMRDKQGRTQEAQEFLAQAQKLSPEMAKGYDTLRNLQVY